MKRGSALLIVLGLISFMIVSAVAFATYMRYARVPSSYLRRSSASRHLLKAALAEAIDFVDAAIGNDPYPGCGNNGGGSQYSVHTQKGWWTRQNGEAVNTKRNYWTKRCLIGDASGCSVEDTASTLTLEGLAYLPPPMINEARYYSRQAATAKWQTFGFDTGRYAFTAYDVSDMLDINRLWADVPRDSSVENRITLSYVFENAQHSGYTAQPAAWDSFMDGFNADDGKLPLVSVADMNLAIWDKKPAGVISPWCRYIEQGTKFVLNNDAQDPEASMLRNMNFITDSWCPATNATALINLASVQPLAGLGTDSATKQDVPLDQVLMNNNSFWTKLQRLDSVSLPLVMQLLDYLDRDSIPCTLAAPVAERAPMVVGMALVGELMVVPEMQNGYPKQLNVPATPQPGQEQQHYQISAYNLGIQGNLILSVGFAYPFKYEHNTADRPSFKAQAAMSIVFVPKGKAEGMRCAQAIWPAVVERDRWSASREPAAMKPMGDVPSPIVAFSDIKTLSIPARIRQEADTIIKGDFDFDMSFARLQLGMQMEASKYGNDTATATFRTVRKVGEDGKPVGGFLEQTCGFAPLNELLTGVDVTEGRIGNLNVMPKNAEYEPVVQVWVRVFDDSGNWYDLVPACPSDDKVRSEFLNEAADIRERPVLRFTDSSGKTTVQFNGQWFEEHAGKGEQATISPAAYLADDPRFNYAPENLRAVTALEGKLDVGKLWLQSVSAREAKKDGDIFMATSDAGYMQSPWELCHLLAVTPLRNAGEWGTMAQHGYNGTRRMSNGELAAAETMWCTYNPWDDPISELNIVNGTGGFRISPWTSSPNVMLAALSNTPVDWWAASTNDVNDAAKQKMLSSLSEANKHTFSNHAGAEVKVDYDCFQELAENFVGWFYGSGGTKPWGQIYDDLDWEASGTEEEAFHTMLNVDFGSDVWLHSVDRKYLYGFWRDCLGVQQQLFLIFVRAEPMMIGGGGMGVMPPQLGGRGVALVWRDPTPTKTANAPHRTRLLFFRQFD